MITLPEEVESKSVIVNAVKLEMKDINGDITAQNSYKKQLIAYLREYTCSIDYQETDTVYDDVSSIASYFKKCDYNIHLLERLLATLLDLKVNLYQNTISKSLDAIKNYNDNYVLDYESINLNSDKIKAFINTGSSLLSEPVKEKEYIENTLVISQESGKVILPYCLDNIYEFLKNNDAYISVDDVIDKIFTRPLKYYKNQPVARFKEAYKLVIDREKGTKKEALDLAFELAFNSHLHPAVITACKSLDELDIYLSCLEYNELDDFHFFKVQFKVAPALTSDQKVFKNILARFKKPDIETNTQE